MGVAGTEETEVAVVLLPTEDATEALIVTETPETPVALTAEVTEAAATSEVVPTEELTVEVVPTEAVTEAVATEETTPETLPTEEPTETPTLTRTPRPSRTPAPSRTPTEAPSEVPELSATPERSDIRLVYNETQFWLINTSGENINISNLVFEQRPTNGDLLQFEASIWDEHQVLQPTSDMETNACYQIVAGRASREAIGRDECLRFLGWYGAAIPSRFFWVSSDPTQTFTVRWLGDQTTIATCPVSVGECRFNLPTE